MPRISLPTLSRHWKSSKKLAMKTLPLVAGALLWCTSATAGHVTLQTTPLDSLRTKAEFKKAELKKSDDLVATPIKMKDIKEVKPIDKELRTDDGDTTIGLTPTAKHPLNAESKSNAEEMRQMAKRDSKKPAKEPVQPTVSYPYYPGGNIAVREFVRKNKRYPQECKRERLTGRVEVLISIAPDGTPHSATISKSSGNVHMDAEALRIAELMPKWQPAAESDDPQGIDYVIYVNFRPGR